MTIRWLLTALTLLLVSSCAAPYMSADDCTNMCHKDGKKVASYIAGIQIPIFLPRPSTRCVCEESAND